MKAPVTYRYRIHYEKQASVRFTSHLDLQRAWERIFRRASIPLAFTQGYHPHPRINLGLALPLGWVSDCELLDIWLTSAVPPEMLQTGIKQSAPAGLAVQNIETVVVNSAKLQQLITAAQYEVRLDPDDTPADLEQLVAAMLQQISIMRDRRGKQYDLRPLIEDVQLIHKNGEMSLFMHLSALPSATGRADEVLLELGIDPLNVLIERKAIVQQS